MGANEEQIQLLISAHVDHVSYSLVIYSLAFVLYFCKFLVLRSDSSRPLLDLAVHLEWSKRQS